MHVCATQESILSLARLPVGVCDETEYVGRLIARSRIVQLAERSERENISDNYSPVYDRLVSVKSAYDPMNLFRLNSNVRPMV